jgi:hypothetical protein
MLLGFRCHSVSSREKGSQIKTNTVELKPRR